MARAIGSVYGPEAEQAFLPLWRKHIGMVVDYTVGAATGDRGKQDKAVADLVGYTDDFGAFLQSANPNLPKSVVADLVKHHVLTLKAVIDAQAAKDQERAFTALRTGAGHMQMIADPLAGAIVKQFPAKIAGATDTPAAGLRTMLNLALREHVYLASAATNAALGGRVPCHVGKPQYLLDRAEPARPPGFTVKHAYPPLQKVSSGCRWPVPRQRNWAGSLAARGRTRPGGTACPCCAGAPWTALRTARSPHGAIAPDVRPVTSAQYGLAAS